LSKTSDEKAAALKKRIGRLSAKIAIILSAASALVGVVYTQVDEVKALIHFVR
jgi:hypothetical protein